MQWFRMYGEFATDSKVQSLSETLQRRYIMILCLKCNGEIPKLSDEEVSCALRISEEETQSTKEKLICKGLITEQWEPVNWDKRQYVSDTSNDRVKKYRSKVLDTTLEKEVVDIVTDTDTEKITLPKRKCNVTVTLQEKTSYATEVKMLSSEYDKLIDLHGETATMGMIEILDNYKGSSGKTYKSDYKAILSWVVNKWEKEKRPQQKKLSNFEICQAMARGEEI